MIVGVAGHIDHGKTSLVQALTGVDCDRLAAEKEQGITIELGFAYSQSNGQQLGFVDVPGHEKLIRTMLAGMAGIDLVMLVVAADDGPMPQTREHLQIARLLGHKKILVALTKCDLASAARVVQAGQDIIDLLAEEGLTAYQICPVSSVTGQGLEGLGDALKASRPDTAPETALAGCFRMTVDRSFTLKGIGTVVTGTVVAGQVHLGDALRVMPNGTEARVRSLHFNGTSADHAQAGARCAVGLGGRGVSPQSVPKGAVLEQRPGLPTRRFDVSLQLRPEQARKKPNLPIRFHHLASETLGRLVVLSWESCPRDGTVLGQIETEKDVSLRAGERFILRDISATRTIGGGRILDVHPRRRKRSSPARLAYLRLLDKPDQRTAMQAVLNADTGAVHLDQWFTDWGLPLQSADTLGLVALADGWAMTLAKWSALAERILAHFAAFHAENPSDPGLRLANLFSAEAFASDRHLTKGAVSRLIKDGTLQTCRGWIKAAGFEIQTPPSDNKLLAQILPLLAEDNAFDPPRVRDIARQLERDEKTIRPIMRRAEYRGELIEVETDRFFLPESLTECAAILQAAIGSDQQEFITLARFRDRLGVGRRVALVLLKHFVRAGLIHSSDHEYYLGTVEMAEEDMLVSFEAEE